MPPFKPGSEPTPRQKSELNTTIGNVKRVMGVTYQAEDLVKSAMRFHGIHLEKAGFFENMEFTLAKIETLFREVGFDLGGAPEDELLLFKLSATGKDNDREVTALQIKREQLRDLTVELVQTGVEAFGSDPIFINTARNIMRALGAPLREAKSSGHVLLAAQAQL